MNGQIFNKQQVFGFNFHLVEFVQNLVTLWPHRLLRAGGDPGVETNDNESAAPVSEIPRQSSSEGRCQTEEGFVQASRWENVNDKIHDGGIYESISWYVQSQRNPWLNFLVGLNETDKNPASNIDKESGKENARESGKKSSSSSTLKVEWPDLVSFVTRFSIQILPNLVWQNH